MDSEDIKPLLSSNLGHGAPFQLFGATTLDYHSSSDNHRDDQLNQWASTLASYQKFLEESRYLESQYITYRHYRLYYKNLTGILLWFTLTCLILQLPLCVPQGWSFVCLAYGWTLFFLGAQCALYSVVPFIISWITSASRGVPNPVYFLTAHLEVQFISLCILTSSALLIIHGYQPERTGLVFSALCVLLLVLFYAAGRICLIRSSYPKLFLLQIFLVALGFIGFYLTAEGIFHGSFWWSSYFGPSVKFGLSCLIAAGQYFHLAMRHLRKSHGILLGWGFSFRHRFMMAIARGPFLVSRANIHTNQHHHDRLLLGQNLIDGDVVSKSVRELKTTSESDLNIEQYESSSKETHRPVALSTSGTISPNKKIKLLNSRQRFSRNKNHFRLLQLLRQGYFIGGFGWILLGMGILSFGIYLSRHHDYIEQRLIKRASLQHSVPMNPPKDPARRLGKWDRLRALFRRETDLPGPLMMDGGSNDVPPPHLHHENSHGDVHGHSHHDHHSLSHEYSFLSRSLELNNNHHGMNSFLLQRDQRETSEKLPKIGKVIRLDRILDNFLMTEQVVGSSFSWWFSLVCLTIALVFLMQPLSALLGNRMEYLAFAYFDPTNRNQLFDLNLPDIDIQSPEFLDAEVTEKAELLLKKLEENSFDIFMRPNFNGCHVPSTRPPEINSVRMTGLP